MPKSKKENSKSNGAETSDPSSDPQVLFFAYSAFCKEIGLTPHEGVKQALTNEENPNNGKQILISIDEDRRGNSLGPGGCRALATALLGRCPRSPRCENGKPIIYSILKEIRIWRDNINDEGTYALAEILRLGGAELQLSFLEIAYSNIGTAGAKALGKSLSIGVSDILPSYSMCICAT